MPALMPWISVRLHAFSLFPMFIFFFSFGQRCNSGRSCRIGYVVTFSELIRKLHCADYCYLFGVLNAYSIHINDHCHMLGVTGKCLFCNFILYCLEKRSKQNSAETEGVPPEKRLSKLPINYFDIDSCFYFVIPQNILYNVLNFVALLIVLLSLKLVCNTFKAHSFDDG